MIHNSIKNIDALNSSAHYAVNDNERGEVLVQIDDGRHQVRIRLTIEEADHLQRLIRKSIIRAMTYYADKDFDEIEKLLNRQEDS